MKRFFILLTVLLVISFSVVNLEAASKTKRSKSTTVKDANGDIYEQFISYSGDLLSSEEISSKIKKYGTYSGNRGMTLTEFQSAMSTKWRDITLYTKKNKEVAFQFRRTLNELGVLLRNL